MKYGAFPMTFTFMLAVTLAITGTYIPGIYDPGHHFGLALVADLLVHFGGVYYVVKNTESVTKVKS